MKGLLGLCIKGVARQRVKKARSAEIDHGMALLQQLLRNAAG